MLFDLTNMIPEDDVVRGDQNESKYGWVFCGGGGGSGDGAWLVAWLVYGMSRRREGRGPPGPGSRYVRTGGTPLPSQICFSPTFLLLSPLSCPSRHHWSASVLSSVFNHIHQRAAASYQRQTRPGPEAASSKSARVGLDLWPARRQDTPLQPKPATLQIFATCLWHACSTLWPSRLTTICSHIISTTAKLGRQG